MPRKQITSFSLPIEMLEAIDNFRKTEGLRSCSEAAFVLMGLGLKLDPKPYLALRSVQAKTTTAPSIPILGAEDFRIKSKGQAYEMFAKKKGLDNIAERRLDFEKRYKESIELDPDNPLDPWTEIFGG